MVLESVLCNVWGGGLELNCGGPARRSDAEEAVVELGGDVLIRAGARGMRRRQVGRKRMEKSARADFR
jgi:hypothetical protein